MTPLHRVTAILSRPKATWRLIAQESATTRSIFLGYVAPLSALPAIAGALKVALGYGAHGLSTWVVSALIVAVDAAGLVALGAFTFVFCLLVTIAGVRMTGIAASKLIAYSSTAALVGAALSIVSSHWLPAALGGGYSIYLFLTGLRPVTECTAREAAVCSAVMAACVMLACALVASKGLPYCAGSRALTCTSADLAR